MNTLISNTSFEFPTYALSSRPTYVLTPRPPLHPLISDFHLSLFLPICAYWSLSLIFAFISYYDLFSNHRIHTPAELQTRNRATVRDILRSVILQQVLQTAWGLFLGHVVLGTQETVGKENYDVAVWTEWVGAVLSWVSWGSKWGVAALGVDLVSSKGGLYLPVHISITNSDGQNIAWETVLAKLIYWVLVPAARFGIAICFSDAWQYFWHRAMHENKWMYRNIHSLHHRVHVPYAFGAFYNTLSEAFLLDTVGTTLALFLSGLSTREATLFSTISVLKGVDDHCGYTLPWDPLQWLGEQDTAFHDVHHQSWGAGTNYSQLYTTFWDHIMGTECRKSREEVSKLYKRSRDDAEKVKNI